MNKRNAARLETYERRYRDLAAQLAQVGYIAAGSLAPRLTRCGRTNCSCHSDPKRRHGPYWHLTTTVDGKTVNRRLSPQEAELYKCWIDNNRKVQALLGEMRALAAKATELILTDLD
jgi:hypothetical protein